MGVIDRQPTLPGRISLTDSDGVTTYYTMAMADEPTQVGTAINKSLLDGYLAGYGVTSGTSTALTLDIPNFVLADGATVRFRLHTDTGDKPTLNVSNTGAYQIRTQRGRSILTGLILGTWVTVTYSSVLQEWIVPGVYTEGAPPTSAGDVLFSESGTFIPSDYGLSEGSEITITCVGGGASGGGGRQSYATYGGGGAGGISTAQITLSAADLSGIPVTIGSGGKASAYVSRVGNSPNPGGSTSFGTYVTAVGGSAGSSQGGNSGTGGASGTGNTTGSGGNSTSSRQGGGGGGWVNADNYGGSGGYGSGNTSTAGDNPCGGSAGTLNTTGTVIEGSTYGGAGGWSYNGSTNQFGDGSNGTGGKNNIGGGGGKSGHDTNNGWYVAGGGGGGGYGAGGGSGMYVSTTSDLDQYMFGASGCCYISWDEVV